MQLRKALAWRIAQRTTWNETGRSQRSCCWLWVVLMRRNHFYALNVVLPGVAAVFVVLAPQRGLAQWGTLDTRTLCKPLEVHEGGPQETACLKELAGVAKRDGGVLTLKLTNGKT